MPRFQKTRLDVIADFVSDARFQTVYMRPSDVAGNVISNRTDIVQVQNSARSGLVATGITTGTAQVALIVNSVNRGSTVLQVVPAFVSVLQVELTVLKSLSLGGYVTPFRSNGSVVVLATAVNQPLIAEFETAFVYSAVLFSDQQREVIDVTDGLMLSSKDNTVLNISGANVVALGTGSGKLVQGVLTSGECNASVVSTGLGYAAVVLPAATGVVVDQYTAKLTVPSDPAALAPTPFSTQSQLRVRLVYPGNAYQ